MSGSWSQEGQPPTGTATRRCANPPPVCFTCGQEGHFVVDCPEAVRAPPATLTAARSSKYAPQRDNLSEAAQRLHWPNGHKVAVVAQYPFKPAVTMRSVVPNRTQQFGNSISNNFSLPPAPYQQYIAPGPAAQSYPPQAGPPQQYPPQPAAQQYGPPAPYSYSQPPTPQPYSAPPSAGQYARPPYQPPPYNNQYSPSSAPPQQSGPGYQNPSQQYGPPAGASYQAPPSPYPPLNAGYGGNYTEPPVPYHPPQQWNQTPTSRSAPPYQRQQGTASQQCYQGEFSGTPTHQSYHPQQTPQQEYGSESYQPTPQTPASNYGNRHDPAGSQGSPTVVPPESKVSSRASTPYGNFGRRGSAVSVVKKEAKHESSTAGGKELREGANPDAEAGDAEEPIDEEQQFNWDFKYILKEPPKPETVALAQPLSTTFDMTPVPQVDPRAVRSVSRYARNENLKEFTRGIRSSPQWSYLQEDPAFTDAALEGPLISLVDLPSWIAKRQGIEEPADSGPRAESRKRAWSDEQDDVDNQIKLEVEADTEDEGYSKKRQKNEENKEIDNHMVEAEEISDRLATPRFGTPVLGRSGTPCLANVDDAWAPSPGERASSPQDPTEVLLASLGVTGSPKPVVEELLPPYTGSTEDQYEEPEINGPPQAHPGGQFGSHLPTSATSSNIQQTSGPPPSNNVQINTLQPRSQYGPPSNPPYANGLPAHSPASNAPYGPPRNASWGNGPPVNVPYGSAPQNVTQYGPPVNHPYNGGQPAHAQYGAPQYVPPHQASWGNGPPQNAQYGPPQYANTPTPSAQYGAPQYGNAPPQGSPQNSQYSGSHHYGSGPPQNAQYESPQYSNVPPQNAQYSAPQYGPQYGNTPPHGPPQYPNGPPQYNNGPSSQAPYGNVPPRQDSGYASTRGSYSNGFNNNPQQEPPNGARQSGQGSAPPSLTENADRQNSHNGETGNSEGTIGTPLSPTSAEILGKLGRKSSNAKKSEPKADETGRKTKRPQPVVAEAYSRRW